MKHSNLKFLFSFLALTVFFAFVKHAFADDYITLVNSLPGVGAQTNLSTYLPAIFKLSIGIAAALAFAMITFGGIVYATSDAISGKSKGKEYIEDALWGFLLVIGAYAILWTINPQILEFNLSLPTPQIQGGATTTPAVTGSTSTCLADGTGCTYTNGVLNGYTMTALQIQSDATTRSEFLSKGVIVNGLACKFGQTTGCTNVNDLPPSAITELEQLANNCKCSVVITGGTEGGHAAHGPGKPVVDISPSSAGLSTYLATANPAAKNPVGQPNPTVILIGGGKFTYENTGDNGRATAPHWHVVYQ